MTSAQETAHLGRAQEGKWPTTVRGAPSTQSLLILVPGLAWMSKFIVLVLQQSQLIVYSVALPIMEWSQPPGLLSIPDPCEACVFCFRVLYWTTKAGLLPRWLPAEAPNRRLCQRPPAHGHKSRLPHWPGSKCGWRQQITFSNVSLKLGRMILNLGFGNILALAQ